MPHLDEPRVAPLPESDWDEAQREIMKPFVEQGRVFNVFATLVNHPQLFRRWLVFANHVLGKSTLELRDREILILRIGLLARLRVRVAAACRHCPQRWHGRRRDSGGAGRAWPAALGTLLRTFHHGATPMRLAIVLLAVLLAGFASAQTVMEVPQGSGVFPTVGQVDCMEPVNGRRCAATYECGDQAGTLWGDMASNDGSRAINAASPVASGRGCVVTVDGNAAATWYRGYRPGGTGEAVGVTELVGALRPVQRVQGAASGDGSLLEYLLALFDTSVPEMIEDRCGYLRPGYPQRDRCEYQLLEQVVAAEHLSDSPITRCFVEDKLARGVPELQLLTDVALSVIHGGSWHFYRLLKHEDYDKACLLADGNDVKTCECWTLYREELERWAPP